MNTTELYAGLQFDQRSGLWYRPGTYDLGTIHRERGGYRPLNLGPTDTVLDIGGHLGSFVDFALRCNVHNVITVEPAPDNLRVMRANCQQQAAVWGERIVFQGVYYQRVTIYEGAVVRNYEPTHVDLYLNNGISHGTHSIIPRRGRKNTVAVRVIDFDLLLSQVHPTAVKIDIEGSEYNLLWPSPNFPPCVRKVAVELHRTRKDWKQLADLVDGMMQAEGFGTVVRPQKVGRATLGIWSR